MLLQLIVKQLIQKSFARQFPLNLVTLPRKRLSSEPPRPRQLAQNHLQSPHLPRFIDILKQKTYISFGQLKVIPFLNHPFLKHFVQLMQLLPIPLIQVPLETFHHFFKKYLLLLDETLVAFFIQDSLK